MSLAPKVKNLRSGELGETGTRRVADENFRGNPLGRALNDTLSPFGPLCSVTKFNALLIGAPLNLLEETAGG